MTQYGPVSPGKGSGRFGNTMGIYVSGGLITACARTIANSVDREIDSFGLVVEIDVIEGAADQRLRAPDRRVHALRMLREGASSS